MTENKIENGIDWTNIHTYEVYVSLNLESTDFNIIGDRFGYDKEKRIISRTDDDIQYYYIYENDIIYVCEYDEDEDVYFYKYNTSTHDVKEYYDGRYFDKNIESIRYIFRIYNDDTVTYMLNNVEYEPEQGTKLEFWESPVFYLDYVRQFEHLRYFDDYDNKFIFDREGVVIYREDANSYKYFYAYRRDEIYVYCKYDDNVEFYRCYISKDIVIMSNKGKHTKYSIKEKTDLFSIHREDKTIYMNLKVYTK